MLSKLAKMKQAMPKKKSDAEMMSDFGLEEGSPEEEASESPDEAAAEGDDAGAPVEDAGSEHLAAIPDEELLAEIKKRGLEAQLKGAPAGKKPLPPFDDSADDQSAKLSEQLSGSM